MKDPKLPGDILGVWKTGEPLTAEREHFYATHLSKLAGMETSHEYHFGGYQGPQDGEGKKNKGKKEVGLNDQT